MVSNGLFNTQKIKSVTLWLFYIITRNNDVTFQLHIVWFLKNLWTQNWRFDIWRQILRMFFHSFHMLSIQIFTLFERIQSVILHRIKVRNTLFFFDFQLAFMKPKLVVCKIYQNLWQSPFTDSQLKSKLNKTI